MVWALSVFSDGAPTIWVSVWKNGPGSAASMIGGVLNVESPIALGGDWKSNPPKPPSCGKVLSAGFLAPSTLVKKFWFVPWSFAPALVWQVLQIEFMNRTRPASAAASLKVIALRLISLVRPSARMKVATAWPSCSVDCRKSVPTTRFRLRVKC